MKSVSQTYYRGLERMCWTDEKRKVQCYDAPRKWYHENTILIENDSIFIYKIPLQIIKNKKLYSASDGVFYYYYGVIKQVDTSQIAYLTSYNCDYCVTMVKKDSLTGFMFPVPRLDTLRIIKGNENITIGKTVCKSLKPTKEFYFPAKRMFYFNSNSISRRNPKGQYGLISQGIKNFLQTKQLKIENDTLRICIDRFDDYEEKNLIETLDQNQIKIDSSNLILKFYTNRQLNDLQKNFDKPIRVIKIKDIIDYWQVARISLAYEIILPNNIHNFSERQYNNLFEYNKIGQNYELIGDLPENSWGLVEKK